MLKFWDIEKPLDMGKVGPLGEAVPGHLNE